MRAKQAQAVKHDSASSAFCFAKIAWQFAPHTRDRGCFLEGILVNAYETCRQHNCRVYGFDCGR